MQVAFRYSRPFAQQRDRVAIFHTGQRLLLYDVYGVFLKYEADNFTHFPPTVEPRSCRVQRLTS